MAKTVSLHQLTSRHTTLWVVALTLAGLLLSPARAQEPPAPPGSPPPVNTQDHPDALILNVKNPLAVHAGPGKPNVGAVFIPPTLSGKDKGKGQKAGATEQQVMGATPK
jgi:hypothetical protein